MVENGGSCVNLGRQLQSGLPDLHAWVIDQTKFLTNPKNFNERVYCLIHGITEQPRDHLGQAAKFGNLFTGYQKKPRAAARHRNDQQRELAQQQAAEQQRQQHQQLLQLAQRAGLATVDQGQHIQNFLKRSQRLNPELYLDSAIPGQDYVECPLTGIRKYLITKAYTQSVLGLTIEEYLDKVGDIQLIADVRSQKISQSLQQVDPDTGMTKYQLSQEKSREKLKSVDPATGLTGYQKKGLKTRASHLKNIDEYGRNGYSQLAAKAILKGNSTKAKNGLITDPATRDEFYRYKRVVYYFTNRVKKEIASGYKLGLAGTEDSYHVDHIYSVLEGYVNKVSPRVIGSKENLRVIPWKDNVSKSSSSDVELSELFSRTGCSAEQSIMEFDLSMSLIREDMANGSPVSGAKIAEKIYETRLLKK